MNTPIHNRYSKKWFSYFGIGCWNYLNIYGISIPKYKHHILEWLFWKCIGNPKSLFQKIIFWNTYTLPTWSCCYKGRAILENSKYLEVEGRKKECICDLGSFYNLRKLLFPLHTLLIHSPFIFPKAPSIMMPYFTATCRYIHTLPLLSSNNCNDHCLFLFCHRRWQKQFPHRFPFRYCRSQQDFVWWCCCKWWSYWLVAPRFALGI